MDHIPLQTFKCAAVKIIHAADVEVFSFWSVINDLLVVTTATKQTLCIDVQGKKSNPISLFVSFFYLLQIILPLCHITSSVYLYSARYSVYFYLLCTSET